MEKQIFHEWPGETRYLPLRTYLEDIERMRKLGPWKLPLRMGDRLQLWLLKILLSVSWFGDRICLLHPHRWSSAHQMLLVFLYKQGIFASITEKQLSGAPYFSYLLKKGKISGQGIAKDRDTALSKAMGEMLERMISGMGDLNKKRVRASVVTLEKRGCVAWYPPRLHRFLDVQKEYFPQLCRARADVFEWVWGENSITKQKTAIPRQMTSWFFGASAVKEPILLDPNSNGCAGYFTRTGAVLRGVLEVVHRDGFLVHWLTMIPPRVIAQATLPEKFRSIIQGFAAQGIEISILDVTALDIPSVYVAGIGLDQKTSRIILSGASGVTFEEAIESALEEMVLFSPTFRAHKPAPSVNFSEPFISALGQKTRQLYWRGETRVEAFRWFLSGESITYAQACEMDMTENESDQKQLASCLERLKKQGQDYYPIVYFPEHPIQETLGFFVAQVYIPGAFPLYLNERYGTFESDRLHAFALAKGKRDWKLNPLPHMFS